MDIFIDLIVILALILFFYAVLFPLEKVSYEDSVIYSAYQNASLIAAYNNITINSIVEKNECENISFGTRTIIVSITEQHLWACNGDVKAYDTAVTTGAYKIGDITPLGTWKIYAKQTNRYLTGPGYRYFVHYWMPFYGNYGFHDATWQTFKMGSSIYGTEGSSGCVHLSLGDAAWLFNWASIGTTVTIKN